MYSLELKPTNNTSRSTSSTMITTFSEESALVMAALTMSASASSSVTSTPCCSNPVFSSSISLCLLVSFDKNFSCVMLMVVEADRTMSLQLRAEYRLRRSLLLVLFWEASSGYPSKTMGYICPKMVFHKMNVAVNDGLHWCVLMPHTFVEQVATIEHDVDIGVSGDVGSEGCETRI